MDAKQDLMDMKKYEKSIEEIKTDFYVDLYFFI